MSFVPAPQASAANAASANNAQVTTPAAAAPAADGELADKDLLFKIRTFDVYWVDKTALMTKDGFDKVSLGSAGVQIRKRRSIHDVMQSFNRKSFGQIVFKLSLD